MLPLFDGSAMLTRKRKHGYYACECESKKCVRDIMHTSIQTSRQEITSNWVSFSHPSGLLHALKLWKWHLWIGPIDN